jgi:hypothetical protein
MTTAAGKLQAALTYLRNAVSIEEAGWLADQDAFSNPAATHINLCAVLGAMARHSEALESARKAIHFASSSNHPSCPEYAHGHWRS